MARDMSWWPKDILWSAPDLSQLDPEHPGFVPLHERTARQQARWLVAQKFPPVPARAIRDNREEVRSKLNPLQLTWATED